MKPSAFTIICGFVPLFAFYHLAEYMILSQNSPWGFLFFSFLFFPLAYLIARWQGDKSLKSWGLSIGKAFPANFLTGLLTGLAVSIAMLLACLFFTIEEISFVPPLRQFIPQAAMLVFGCALSSLTEDVLTRCYVYRHAKRRWSKPTLVLFSALLFGLNHIHRLDEPVYFLYALVLGVQLAIPLVVTGNIWYTLGVHWAGNIVYHLANSVMHTAGGSNPFPAIAVVIIVALMAIPLHYFVCRQLAGDSAAPNTFAAQRHSSPVFRHSSEPI